MESVGTQTLGGTDNDTPPSSDGILHAELFFCASPSVTIRVAVSLTFLSTSICVAVLPLMTSPMSTQGRPEKGTSSSTGQP